MVVKENAGRKDISKDWLNWLMSQYRKTNVAEFFFQSRFTICWSDPFLEIDSIAVAEIWWTFQDSFSARVCTFSSFSQDEKAITREQNEIDFGGYFIYGGNFMNSRTSDRHAHQVVQEHNKQPLNCIILIQVGKVHSCFVDLKPYFSVLKLIQSLFKSQCLFS